MEPGEETLSRAVSRSSAGDRIVLKPGRYLVEEVLPIAHLLTVAGPARGEATLLFSRSVLFEIAQGGSLKLENLAILGSAAPDQAGNAVILRGGKEAIHTSRACPMARWRARGPDRARRTMP